MPFSLPNGLLPRFIQPPDSLHSSQPREAPPPTQAGWAKRPTQCSCGLLPLHVTSHTAVVLPRWLGGKESTCQHWRCGFDPWVGKIPWTRKWQPTPVFLPGESHGQRSLVGCGHGVSEPDATEDTCMLTLIYLLVSPFPRGTLSSLYGLDTYLPSPGPGTQQVPVQRDKLCSCDPLAQPRPGPLLACVPAFFSRALFCLFHCKLTKNEGWHLIHL